MLNIFIPTPKTLFNLLLTAIVILSLAALTSLSGCAATEKAQEEQPSADILSDRAMEAYNHGKYATARDLFQKIQNRFPFSKYSLKAKIREADCHYHEGHYNQAISVYQKFTQDHPSHKAMPYALFQIGRSYAQRIDTVDRDPTAAEKAEDAFKNLISRYPDSPYTAEAQKQIKQARNFLARHEMYVAGYYLKTGKHKQAESRLEYLVNQYPDSKQAEKAEKFLAAIEAGNPPQSSWLNWIPLFGMLAPSSPAI
ncbi:MAG: outer membrane protein assembly factor BamD [Desulfurivibrionaceae bacterium]